MGTARPPNLGHRSGPSWGAKVSAGQGSKTNEAAVMLKTIMASLWELLK